jgi:pimeloyl-ACP methyl ester carboxylesterase
MRFHARRTDDTPSLLIAERPATGCPLLLLHGLSRAHGDWAPVVDQLARSHRLIAIDHRGHGESDRASGYLVADYVADAVRILVDEIDEPVLILGHSLGAMVAAAVAAEVPGHVRGVVLADPPFHAMGARIAGSSWQTLFRGMQAAAGQGVSVDELAALMSEILLPRPDGSRVRLGDLRDAAAIRWSATCLASLDPAALTPVIEGRWLDGYDMLGVASRIRCPVHLMQADPAAGGCLSDDESAAFAGCVQDCIVERCHGIGHLLHWQAPARVTAAVAALSQKRCQEPFS